MKAQPKLAAALRLLATLIPQPSTVLAQRIALTCQGSLHDAGNAPSSTNKPATVLATLRNRFYCLIKP